MVKKKEPFAETRCVSNFEAGDVRKAIINKGYVWSCERDGGVRIRCAKTQKSIGSFHKKQVFAWCVTACEDNEVWVGHSDGSVRIHSNSSPFEFLKELPSPSGAGCHSIYSQGDSIYVGYGNCQIIKWSKTTRQRMGNFIGHTGGHGSAVRAIDFDSSTGTLFSAADDRTLRSWDTSLFQMKSTYKGHTASVLTLAVIGERIWSGSEDQTLKIWNKYTQKTIKTVNLRAPVGSLLVVGDRVVVGTWARSVAMFSIDTMSEVSRLNPHKGAVTSLLKTETTTFYTMWSFGTDKKANIWVLERSMKSGKPPPEDVNEAILREADLEKNKQIEKLEEEIAKLKAEAVAHTGTPDPGEGFSFPVIRRRASSNCSLIDLKSDVDVKELKFELQNTRYQISLLKTGLDRLNLMRKEQVSWMAKGRVERVVFGKLKYFSETRKRTRAILSILVGSSATQLRRTYLNKLLNFTTLRRGSSKKGILASLLCSNTETLLRSYYYKCLSSYCQISKRAKAKQTTARLLLVGCTHGMIRIYFNKLIEHVMDQRKHRRRRRLQRVLSKNTRNGLLRISYQYWREFCHISNKKRNKLRCCDMLRMCIERGGLGIAWRRWVEYATVRSQKRGNQNALEMLLRTTEGGQTLLYFNKWLKWCKQISKSRRNTSMCSLITRTTTHGLFLLSFNKLRSFVQISKRMRFKNNTASCMISVTESGTRIRYFRKFYLFRNIKRKQRVIQLALSKQSDSSVRQQSYSKWMRWVFYSKKESLKKHLINVIFRKTTLGKLETSFKSIQRYRVFKQKVRLRANSVFKTWSVMRSSLLKKYITRWIFIHLRNVESEWKRRKEQVSALKYLLSESEKKGSVQYYDNNRLKTMLEAATDRIQVSDIQIDLTAEECKHKAAANDILINEMTNLTETVEDLRKQQLPNTKLIELENNTAANYREILKLEKVVRIAVGELLRHPNTRCQTLNETTKILNSLTTMKRKQWETITRNVPVDCKRMHGIAGRDPISPCLSSSSSQNVTFQDSIGTPPSPQIEPSIRIRKDPKNTLPHTSDYTSSGQLNITPFSTKVKTPRTRPVPF